jgi:transcriptional regulator with XRE-family HTH domain
MNAHVNVPRILQGMKQNGWGVAATCVNCGVNNKTLAKILNGEVPRRLDAFYRVLDGLKIPIGEALNGTASQTPRLTLVRGGRQSPQVA